MKIIPATVCFLLATTTIVAEEPLLFEDAVLPILKVKCAGCHFGENPKGGLDLSRKGTIVRGGKNGPAIRVSAAESSLLFEVISSGKMPLKGEPLSKEEVGLIRTWINDGAQAKDNEILKSEESEGRYNDYDFDYWSFYPPKRPPLPVVTSKHLLGNGIDAFLLAKLEEDDLSFSPRASRHTLIRRLYFDLLGLPPTPQQIAQFIQDSSPNAYEQLVDQLLASPRYGERWGRHWLDIAGYSDSAGVLSADQDRQLIWRYRDYVIRAFNSDKPYDEFVKQQLAGDELSDYYNEYHQADHLSASTIESLDATGFLRTGPDASRPDFNTIKNVNGFYYYPTIDSQVAIVTSSLMGLTLKCAKCHNHKFDPLSQKEYYELQSILMTVYNPDNWVPFASRTLMLASKKQIDAKNTRDAEVDAAIKVINDELASIAGKRSDELFTTRLESVDEQIRDDVRTAFTTDKAARSEIQAFLVDKYTALLKPPADKLQAELATTFPDFKTLVDSKNAEIAQLNQTRHVYDSSYAAYDVEGEPYTPLLLRGDAQTPGQEVQPNVPTMIRTSTAFNWDNDSRPEHTSGRRAELARWITQSRHPLTSRVMANRLWFHHFGEGIVSTLEDFGWAGESPEHKTLLDWLAVELEDNNWSLKHLHRVILTSTAYQQISSQDTELAAKANQSDPQNRLLWRQNLKRLEAESLRDSILYISGALAPKMFGFPDGIQTLSSGEVIVGNGELPQRRSIYVRNKRSAPVSILQLFDQPDIETNCIRRSQSTVPLQALSLMNSDLANQSAESFAESLLLSGNHDPEAIVRQAIISAYGRPAKDLEIKALAEFLADQIASHSAHLGNREAWSYGTGNVDEENPELTKFKHFAHFENGQWQLGPGYPYMGGMWEGLNSTSGHPGGKMGVILRWTADGGGKLNIAGTVNHGSPAGDGVRITVISSKQGQLGQWIVAHGEQNLSMEPIRVEAGEQILFVNDNNGELTSDNFDWHWIVQSLNDDGKVSKTWDSIQGFHGPLDSTQAINLSILKNALTDLCHVLLSSNEFSYID